MAMTGTRMPATIGLSRLTNFGEANSPISALSISDEKSKKERSWQLTVRMSGDYIRPTNEGGTPLAVEKFASRSALCEIQESRVSDTRTAPKPKAKGA
ncbi:MULTISPECIES: hypothetical protein [unclassified Mesorhizobium]|uniref:hypothetical protein n=1 Tax=unclassified Mesorhizobium TaxID=325217 RepID=UPI001092D576|nr:MULTISPECIES: hypothetical protein [unclassified Mesorhizobium]TGP23411.1 hypothetical protein EN874_012715 [Mesorhizobium sp. M1D.F.Ca.ET.231.01.1.1]TGP33553.1 hypothetical protein EN877_12720 [Mesorhizobium sp. M1D.F.Ca.ET.234.01.1.1]TGS46920.1 hypothetical protein EN827_12715 [Mesorhizobium sp. M1D.F.Ca.ET.184.01.1.1]TGS62179.1 hypothetical protein EN826_012715 [Mesorhizobium sp. M1D.F.Ca.ET.183.01.1.1]